MSHHRWVDVPSEQINETVARRFITGDSVTIGRFELKKEGACPRTRTSTSRSAW